MGLSHDSVVKRFAQRSGLKMTGHNVFADGNFLYSYGRHFPLASYLGEREGRHLFLKNGDKYSDSTTHHQGITSHHCPGPTVSDRGLAAFGIKFEDVTFDHILHWQDGFYKYVCKDQMTGLYYEDREASVEWTPPQVGGFCPYKTDRPPALKWPISGFWSVKGATVIQWKRGFYLCAIDETRPYTYHAVWKLGRKPVSIQDAFDSLKPALVLGAERNGLNVKNMGKWFFIPTGMDDKALAKKVGETQKWLKQNSTNFALPEREKDCDYRYVARKYFNYDDIFVRGRVTHRYSGTSYTDGSLTNRYKSVNLSYEWHLALEHQGEEGEV